MTFSYEVEDLFSNSKCNSPTEVFSDTLNKLILALIKDVESNLGKVTDFSEVKRSDYIYEICSIFLSGKDNRVIRFVLKENENDIVAVHVSLFDFILNQQTSEDVLYEKDSISIDLLKNLVSLFSLVESKRKGLEFLSNSDIQLILSKIKESE